MALYKGDVRIAGIGSFPDQIQYMSQDDYNSLSETEKMNGTTYGIVGTAETPDPSLALKFEFVEKVVVTTNQNTAALPNTYDYYTFVIAEFINPSNKVTSSLLKGKGESSWSYWAPDGSGLYRVMDSSFFPPNSLIELTKEGGTGTYTANFWIYKIDLPEE